jgi:hypothetical protein
VCSSCKEQEIGVAEWGFDNNPDIVSWLSGMVVKPVLGVPFSQANLELFRDLDDEAVFAVTMNTGNVLQFVYGSTEQVTRTRHLTLQAGCARLGVGLDE